MANIDTPIWPIEGVALESVDPAVAGSLADVVLGLDTNIDTIDADTSKIDDAAVDGLSGTSNSLAYKVAEIERHFHSGARWFETASVPDAEVHVADEIGSGGGAFRIDSGTFTWGSWLQVLGSDDTPTVEGKVYFDGKPSNRTYLHNQLRALAVQNRKRPIRIDADAKAPFIALAEVLNACQFYHLENTALRSYDENYNRR